MIGWFVWGAMDLAWTIEYAVQAGWALIVSFIWLLPLTELGATEAGVDRRVIGIVTIASTLVPVASRLAIAVFGLRVPASLAVFLLWASQISSPVQKRVMSAVRAAMDFGFSWRSDGRAIRRGCYA